MLDLTHQLLCTKWWEYCGWWTENNIKGTVIAPCVILSKTFHYFKENHEISVEMEVLAKLVGITVTLLTHIREVLSSNFDRDTGYPDSFFVIFLSLSSREIVSRLGHDRFLPNPFHSTLYNLATEAIVTYPTNKKIEILRGEIQTGGLNQVHYMKSFKKIQEMWEHQICYTGRYLSVLEDNSFS
jgi:hypothetical protein